MEFLNLFITLIGVLLIRYLLLKQGTSKFHILLISIILFIPIIIFSGEIDCNIEPFIKLYDRFTKKKCDEPIDKLTTEIKESFQKSKIKQPIKEKNTTKIEQKPIYSEDNYKYNVFDELGAPSDNLLTHKMKQISNRNREAIDNFSRTYTKYSNINYFEQELKDAEQSGGWWDNDELDDIF